MMGITLMDYINIDEWYYIEIPVPTMWSISSDSVLREGMVVQMVVPSRSPRSRRLQCIRKSFLEGRKLVL